MRYSGRLASNTAYRVPHLSRPRRQHRTRTRRAVILIALLSVVAGAAWATISLAPPRHLRRGGQLPGGPPLRVPQAYVATTSGHSTRTAWLSVSPIQRAWYGVGPKPPPVVGPLVANWRRLPHPSKVASTVLYIHSRLPPNMVLVLKYTGLRPTGLPAGRPAPSRCTPHIGCHIQACLHNTALGQCIVLANRDLSGQPVVVVYAEWLVPGVPLTLIKKYGPATDAASWGFVVGCSTCR